MTSHPARTADRSFRTAPAAASNPLDNMKHGDEIVWLRGDEGLVGRGEAARFDLGTGPERFGRAAATLRDLWARAAVDDSVEAFGTGPVAFGSFTFDPRTEGSSLVVPAAVRGARDGIAWTTHVSSGEPGTADSLTPQPEMEPERIRYAGSSLPEVGWLEAVDDAVGTIRARRLEKVVLARDMLVWSEVPLDPRVLVRRLVRRFPQCFTFLYGGLIGASPELLVRRRGSRVESLVLAGSAARGADPSRDVALGDALLASDKDVAEHRLAVESVARVLRPLCSELDVDAAPRLLRLENVQHLATEVRGRLVAPMSALELAGALHPTSAVCGEPTDPAMELIRSLEGMERGRYGGPVGWVDRRGDGEWAIALRCAELSGSRARLFAGAGIVDGSRPEAELEETRLKFRAMLSALEDS